MRDGVRSKISRAAKSQQELLASLQEFLAVKWYDFTTRWSKIRAIRKKIVDLLETISSYHLHFDMMKTGQEGLAELMSNDKLTKQYLELLGWHY